MAKHVGGFLQKSTSQAMNFEGANFNLSAYYNFTNLILQCLTLK
jgi:hypothetical protein